MYVRFFRWASDRIHEDGIIAFITNRSFIDSRNFDGFRKVVAEEFDNIYIIDLGGDWKKKGAAGGGNANTSAASFLTSRFLSCMSCPARER